MMKSQKKWLLMAVAVLVVSILAGCGSKDKETIKLAYVAWDSEIASTHVVKHVFEEKLGYEVEMLQVDAGPMWTGISDGSADAMVAAWLPGTHQSYAEEFTGKYDDLGPNLEGTKIGLVVPAYWDIDSIEDLKDDAIRQAAGSTIYGIEPGAGIMMATENVIPAYGLDGWELLPSSSAGMAVQLMEAYEKEEPIIVTGWTPHWKFGKMDLKYLEDPLGIYGGDENIHTIVRLGLDQDLPDAYKLLDQFYWTAEDMAVVMSDIEDGADPEKAAADWVNNNEAKVNEWLQGIK